MTRRSLRPAAAPSAWRCNDGSRRESPSGERECFSAHSYGTAYMSQPIGNRRVKTGLERRHQRNLRQLARSTAASPRCTADCAPAPRGSFAPSRPAASGVTRCTPLMRAGMHRLEADRRHFARIAQAAMLADRSTAPGTAAPPRHGRAPCAVSSRRTPPISTKQRALAEPIRSTPPRKLPLVGHVEQPILEAGAAQVGDEDLHASECRWSVVWSSGGSAAKR